ncbi:MAG: NADH-quinone oxidoreductase subunit N [Acidobacteriota bacterium]|nr:NADH-quinone oxidoreductase subunit N [Pyrinomonadaceae bacterium]MDW8305165.1 NADH-quinone oxidoreductase subunit N [Acidobacteriota bacterium]
MILSLMNPDVNLWVILPETILAVFATVVMLYDCFAPGNRKVTGVVSIVGISLATLALIWLWFFAGVPVSAWNGMIVTDTLRFSFSISFLITAFITILVSSVWIEREDVPAGEYYSLVLFATLGMLLMASGNDLVVIFLGLETLSLASYVMVGLRKADLRSNEASIKYFVLGSFASAFLLYGIALIYGATGSTNVSEIALKVANANFPGLLFVGAAMMTVGFGFKIASVPFHIWTPDVYEGAPTPVTAFMASGSKAAAFASFSRVFIMGLPLVAGVQASELLHNSWITVVSLMAILTMTFGNVAAILQNNIKRMLAYSSIAHAGYALVGFAGAGMAKTAGERNEAIAAIAFYMLVYSITTLGAFAVINLLAQKNDRRADFEDYNGIGFESPVLSFSLAVFMLSLLGLPLTGGFIGKVLVFRSALQADTPLLTLLVVIAVINTAISAYYYLRLIVVMFFKQKTVALPLPKISSAMSAVLIFTILGVFYLGLFSDRVIRLFKEGVSVETLKVNK